jgi:hypothetical protein
VSFLPGRIDTLVGNGTRTVSSNTGELSALERVADQPADAGRVAAKLRFQLNVTAASGTSPTLDVVVEDTLDGTNWNTVGTFAQRTAAGRQVIDITSPFSGRLRVRWTIGGTSPSFTFSVVGVGLV